MGKAIPSKLPLSCTLYAVHEYRVTFLHLFTFFCTNGFAFVYVKENKTHLAGSGNNASVTNISVVFVFPFACLRPE